MKRVLWLDAFTETRFGGNPCAVVFDADDIPVAERIAFTRETGLVECAFIVSSDRADHGARYYMPTGEIPLAGHPTVATVSAMMAEGVVAPGSDFTLEVGAGVMAIETLQGDDAPPLVTMTQPAPVFGRIWKADDIAALYGLKPSDIIGSPQTVSTGSPFCITHLTGLDPLRRARLDAEALATFKVDQEADFMEPFLCVTEGATALGDSFARLLLPPPFPPEDPFTGSATGCMAAYLFQKGAIKRQFVAEQGHDIGRPGRAYVTLLGPADVPTGVRVGGSSVPVMSGFADIGPEAL